MLAVGQPIAGYVFVLDGVLIGAGDARYLAIAGVVNLAAYLPLLLVAGLTGADGGTALLWLWAAFSLGYMSARALTLGLRARTDKWMLLGAH
jgi:Na+-driven multidrug efflux pump